MHQSRTGSSFKDAWRKLELWESVFDKHIGRLEGEIIKIRRHLHAHPEPSGEETETSKFIAKRLDELGIDTHICRDGLGVIANFELGQPDEKSPRIAIRGDIDALRIPDEKTVSYASRNPGISHSCGHDAHSAILCGAAIAGVAAAGEIEQATSEQPGLRLRLIFQPAEEISAGAGWMVEQGAVEDVDAILGIHVDPERAAGEVGIRYGVLTAHCDEVDIIVEGHGGHSARPHHTADPIAAAAHLISSLYQFLPRSVDSRDPSVFTIGQVIGGYAPNVIPERVELRGSLRCIDPNVRGKLIYRIEEVCKGVEHSSGTRIRVEFSRPLRAVDNHPRVTAALEEASLRIIGVENVKQIDQPSMGGEDFSVYLDHVPGALLRLGCAKADVEAPFLHSPHFDIDERAVTIGTRILFRAALMLSDGPRKSTDEV